MYFQKTIRKKFSLPGKGLYGKSKYLVELAPGKPNTGIVIENENGNLKVEAILANAYYDRNLLIKTLSLEKDGFKVRHVEHLLATLKAYCIENARVRVNKTFFGNTVVIPNFSKRELSLCEKIEEVGLVEQDAPLKFFKFEPNGHNFGDEDKIMLEKSSDLDLSLRLKTDYEKYGGKEEIIFHRTPGAFKEIARARSYAGGSKISVLPIWLSSPFAAIYNPHYGLGHGFKKDYILYRAKSKKAMINLQKENGFNGAEIILHGAIDRLGAIALLENQLGGRIVNTRYNSTKFAGHQDDYLFCKQVYDNNCFKPVIQQDLN